MPSDDAPLKDRPRSLGDAGRSDLSEEIQRGVESLLENKAPELFARKNYRVASDLVDSAASTLLALRERVEVLEAERRKAAAQEAEWQAVLDRWQEIAGGLKDRVRDLERRVVDADRRASEAEARARGDGTSAAAFSGPIHAPEMDSAGAAHAAA